MTPSPPGDPFSAPLPWPPPPGEPNADAPRPGFWRRALDLIGVRIALYYLTAVLLIVVLSVVIHYGLSGIDLARSLGATGAFTLNEGLLALCALAAFGVMTRYVDRRPWSTAGYRWADLPRNLPPGFALGALVLSAGVGLLALLGVYRLHGAATATALLGPLPLYLFVAVFEETFFRGYVFQTIEQRRGSGWAVAVTSLIFGGTHVFNLLGHHVTLAQVVTGPVFIVFEAGILMSAAYVLTRSWWMSIGIHWAWDYCEGPIYNCPDSGTHDAHTLLHATLHGPTLLTGGAFGPEGGLALLLVGTLVGALLLALAIRRGQWRPRPRGAALTQPAGPFPVA